jgi:hypothetical protein
MIHQLNSIQQPTRKTKYPALVLEFKNVGRVIEWDLRYEKSTSESMICLSISIIIKFNSNTIFFKNEEELCKPPLRHGSVDYFDAG